MSVKNEPLIDRTLLIRGFIVLRMVNSLENSGMIRQYKVNYVTV